MFPCCFYKFVLVVVANISKHAKLKYRSFNVAPSFLGGQ